MGKARSGKTSMRSIIFANYLARDTMRLSPTLDVEHSHVRFLGGLVLNLWDCGGQDAFYESYFERDRETIFRGVELLIYVFDIESDSPEKDFDHFVGVLEAIEENSPDARLFVLVHKMDLVVEEERESILEERHRLIEESCIGCGVNNFQFFGTSIWDETLYKAWSEIVTNLIPNISVLETHLNDFCRICDADEVVLFERATFLVITHAQAQHSERYAEEKDGSNALSPADESMIVPMTPDEPTDLDSYVTSPSNMYSDLGPSITSDVDIAAAPVEDYNREHQAQAAQNSPGRDEEDLGTSPHFDAHRFEKISNIIKQFKLSCGKAQSQFQGMEVRNSRFSAFIDAFTANTYVMVIVSQPDVHRAATLLNIRNARRHFEKFIPRIT